LPKKTMTVSNKAAPRPANDHSLADLRREIDAADDAILELLDRRQDLARRVNAFKAAEPAGLALRPDREAFVLTRLLEREPPERRPVILALWREVLGAGLAAQGAVQVVTWSPNGLEAQLGARLRFGASADYHAAASPEAALKAAEEENAVAVLGIDREHPWWADLPRRESLWVFETLGGLRGRDEPAALAVGRVPPGSLARGLSFRVSVGGDSGGGMRGERVIASGPGRRLYAVPDGPQPPALDRSLGWIGAAPLIG
jgi:chorismate mutase